VVREFVSALAAGNEPEIRAALHPDATWWLGGDLPISGTHRGVDKILSDFFGAAQPRFEEGSLELEATNFVADGDRVSVEWKVTGRNTQKRPYENEYHVAFQVEDGKIVAVREYTDTQQVADVLFSDGETGEKDVVVSEVLFNSMGIACAGTFFRPVGKGDAVPAVVICHGFSAVRRMTLPKYAEALAASGIAVLTFDYRFIGESGGEPRYQVYPHEQREDIRNAMTWLAKQPGIDSDRIGLWGSSLGGGHVIQVAVHDSRVKAILTQVPAVSPAKVIEGLPADARATLFDAVEADRCRRANGGGRALIPITAPEGEFSALGSNDLQWHLDMEAQYPPFANLVTLDSMGVMAENDPGAWVRRLAVPVLMVVCENDQTADPDLALETYAEMSEPKELLTYVGDHYDVYDNPDMRSRVIDAAIRFFSKTL
jgi:ketosteroid isomerase-like protein/fermentation-respiration switch protein FrsA (DUF1100 family)